MRDSTAAKIGLDCAESRWLEFKSQSAVVSTRYDRARRNGTVARLHQEDLHQAIGMGRNKYDVDNPKEGVTSTDVLAALRGYSISREDEEASVRAFVDSLIFSALTASTDGHAKNYSLLLEGERVRLAPLYDMASDLPYDTGPGRLALGIGGERSLSMIESSHWEALGREARLSGEYVVDRVHEMADELPQAFAGAFADVGRKARQLRDRTMTSLAEHLGATTRRAARARGLSPTSPMGRAARPDAVWVSEHLRNGRVVAAHLRRRR